MVVLRSLFFVPLVGSIVTQGLTSTNYNDVNMHRTISIRPTDEVVKKLEKLGGLSRRSDPPCCGEF